MDRFEDGFTGGCIDFDCYLHSSMDRFEVF